jgi:5-methylcytosine-specific restriction endonuclease McrBC regulatory subunit McrC
LTGAEKNLLDQLPGPRNERMFEFGLRETRATSFVGVVQLPQTTLQVLPKMYRRVLDGRDGPPGRPPEDDDAARPAVTPYPPDAKEREATANLLFLLSYTRKLDVTEPEVSRLTAQRAPFSEILFWVFAHRLWDAVHREVLRCYVTIEDRLDVLKGRWLVAAQSRKPSGWRRDRFDVAYDEFTEDNLPNRLFKATVHRLSRWSQWGIDHEIHEPHESSEGTRSIASASLPAVTLNLSKGLRRRGSGFPTATSLRFSAVLC